MSPARSRGGQRWVRRALFIFLSSWCALAAGPRVLADDSSDSPATLRLSFTPIDRAQIAVWIERDDGQFMGTLALTYGVARAGLGHPPRARQV
jgi:hypothetical protein